VVPFWAAWPYETLILPKRNISNLLEMNASERQAFADAIRRLTCRYDNLFECSFPYSAGIHQAPTHGLAHPEWTLHMHFYPPLLRSATVKKFMVGYEMLGEPQRDLTPNAILVRLHIMSAAASIRPS
jgi:UDPglucose--hexose-1-phosphate uridylyltransferase